MNYSRRKFIKTAGLATAGTLISSRVALGSNSIWTSNSNTLKVGLIGCGGRGTDHHVRPGAELIGGVVSGRYFPGNKIRPSHCDTGGYGI
ncbi:twin-arginine translocation signal domain-containing protein [Proteiniphilum sp. X52]|uniref:twin-arginine translocation signal domain-containing protein n=1 Tax=Proteiniphilum sp. X52 TaxID=2382159 RepID=UPI000F0A0B3F|nr:twin-arginine translocation signal domain-containing protein [Proteiniphilum sp. X52]RNC63925.1 twin-arginine translocation signal domain-containing protein [Proteiniphilum sp. X52]